MSEAAHLTDERIAEPVAELTPLAGTVSAPVLVSFAGVQTPGFFSSPAEELHALRTGAGAYDLGWRARFRVTGDDRVRWLNGMVTNTVKDLAPGQFNYMFLLNAQGRIQGDGEVYAFDRELLLATDRAQAARVGEHLERFIIMDDVELALEADVTAIGVAGPQAAALLGGAGFGSALASEGRFIEHNGVLVAHQRGDRYTLWTGTAAVGELWERLLAAGAVPCGIEAAEALRVLSGIPRYGADIHDKSLAQETGQTRALHFNKGCYLGQEIVERIRSRATVHRALRVFSLEGETPSPGTPLFAEGKPEAPAGELTSITTVAAAEWTGAYALGTVRTEAAQASLAYAGGAAKALARAPFETD